MSNRFFILFGFAFLLFGQIECFGQVVINEVQYRNKTTLTDNFGENPDWIELYNNSNDALSLKGYKITDDIKLADLWTFPDTVIFPYNYIVVYASGRDKNKMDGLHTGFKLKQMSDPVILLNSSGEIIDKAEITCVPQDKVLGRFPDGYGKMKVLSPSPGMTNDKSQQFDIDYKKDSLSVSHPSGFYTDSMGIELLNQNSSNSIYYTLDGEVPGPESALYGETIVLKDINSNENRFASLGYNGLEPGNLISKGNILRARVYSEGCPASNEIQNIYLISEGDAYKYPVPIVSIITEKDNLFDSENGIYIKGEHKNYSQRGKKWEREAHLEIFDATKTQIIDQDIGIRIHGNGSRGEPQKSLRLCARDEYGRSSFDYKFFKQKDILSFETLILSAERTFSPIVFKDELCTDLVSGMNIDYQAWQPVVAFVNGEYWGIHHLREYQKGDYFFNNHKEEVDSIDIIEYSRGPGPTTIQGNAVSYQEMVDFIANNDINDNEIYSQLSTMIDIDNTIDFYIAQLILANTDFPENNNRMWRSHKQGSKWRWLFYDCEAGMHFAMSDKLLAYSNAPEDKEETPAWSVYIMQNLLSNDSFEKQFYNKFLYYMGNDFAPDIVLGKIKEYEAFYEPLMVEHIYRWGYPNSIGKWKENISTIEQFALRRPMYLNSQLQELFETPIEIYPNPSQSDLQINFYGSPSDKYYKIYDLNGILLFDGEIFCNDVYTLNVDLDNGIYVLQVFIDQFVYSKTIIIQK